MAGVVALPALNMVLVAEPDEPFSVNGKPFVRPANSLGGRLIALGEDRQQQP